jgi:hypothetical protein
MFGLPILALSVVSLRYGFGPLSAAHIGHRVAIKLDLWVRAPARGSQDRARPSPASDRYDGCYVGGVCGLNASIMVRAGISSYSVPPPTRNIYLLISIAYHRRYGRPVWIDPVVLRAITISWNDIIIPVRSCHGHPDDNPLPWFTNDFGLPRMRCGTNRSQVTQDQGRSESHRHYPHASASLPQINEHLLMIVPAARGLKATMRPDCAAGL